MEPKIKVEKLTKIFGKTPQAAVKLLEEGFSKDEILAKSGNTVGISQVSFDVKPGEIFVIMGLSGSGKSTLIRCLNYLNVPTSGKIIVDGENIVEFNKEQMSEYRKNKVAMVFQHFGLFTHMTVKQNVLYGLEIKEVEKEKREQLASDAIQKVGLAGWEDKYPKELSGGMQQRVGLARALANEPEVLLMDEPFSALDPLIRRDMQLELLEIQSELQKTIVFITHDVNEAFKIGDRVAVMKDGVFVQVGTPEEILENPANDYIEDFVKDIDRTKILQAKNVMFTPSTLTYGKDGPKVAINIMQKLGISSIFMLESNRKLKGMITVDDAIRAVKDHLTIDDILTKDYHIVDPETYVSELIPLATESKYPLAVLDESERLMGIIARVSVLAGLV